MGGAWRRRREDHGGGEEGSREEEKRAAGRRRGEQRGAGREAGGGVSRTFVSECYDYKKSAALRGHKKNNENKIALRSNVNNNIDRFA